jgi:hypothetical protein
MNNHRPPKKKRWIGPIIGHLVCYKRMIIYCNPNLGLATKVGACKGVGQEGSPRVTSHTPKNAKECEGMNLHTPSSHFGSWSLGGLPNVQRAITRVKTNWIETFFISLESSWNLDVLNGLAWPIWTSKTQVMGRWWVPPSPGRGESCESKFAHGSS